MHRVLSNPFRKNLIYGFTLKDQASGTFVGLDAEARAKMQGKQTNLNDDTVFYMDEARSHVALLTKMDAVNGMPYYFSLRGQQAVPFVNFSRSCNVCPGRSDLYLNTDGSVTSPGPDGYLQNVAGSEKFAFVQGLKTSRFALRIPNGKFLSINTAHEKFILVQDETDAQMFEYLNGTIIVSHTYNNSDKNWKNWTVEVLKLNNGASAAVLETVKVQTLNRNNTHALFENDSVQLCRGGVCKELRAPSADGTISLLGLRGATYKLVAVFPAASVKDFVVVQYPQDVKKNKRKHMSSGTTAGFIIGSIIFFIILIWVILLLARSAIVNESFQAPLGKEEMHVLSSLLHI
jgi:hypothetical protein